MLVGFQRDGDSIYYLEANATSPNYGTIVTGWVNVAGTLYYFDEAGKYDPTKSVESERVLKLP